MKFGGAALVAGGNHGGFVKVVDRAASVTVKTTHAGNFATLIVEAMGQIVLKNHLLHLGGVGDVAEGFPQVMLGEF